MNVFDDHFPGVGKMKGLGTGTIKEALPMGSASFIIIKV
jgi:hypothetical protein